jgi:hypothetical protein
MAVVIEPSENRAAMAKPPPKKLDAQIAGKISKEEEKEWSSKFSHNSFVTILPTICYLETDRHPFLSMASVKKLGRLWRSKAQA